jgi:hypothetical protein
MEGFLERNRRDALLQRRRKEPAISKVAVAIAEAAGQEIEPADQIVPLDRAPAATDLAADDIDFDGDGVPDAMNVDEKWLLKPQDG